MFGDLDFLNQHGSGSSTVSHLGNTPTLFYGHPTNMTGGLVAHFLSESHIFTLLQCCGVIAAILRAAPEPIFWLVGAESRSQLCNTASTASFGKAKNKSLVFVLCMNSN